MSIENPTELEQARLVTATQNLIDAGVDITQRRKSLDGTLCLIDFYPGQAYGCLTLDQINQFLLPEYQIQSWEDIANTTVIAVNEMLKEGYSLYSSEDAYVLVQTQEWSSGEE